MTQQPLSKPNQYLTPILMGGMLGFIVFLVMTYPLVEKADLPMPPTLIFGSGPRVELQSMLLDMRNDLAWLAVLIDQGFGFIGAFVLASVGIAMAFKCVTDRVKKKGWEIFELPRLPRRYLMATVAGLSLGLVMDFIWMKISIHTLYLHLTCPELLCAQAGLGVLTVFAFDELQRLKTSTPFSSKTKQHITFRVFIAFVGIFYFLFSSMFAWPCNWFLNQFPYSDWSRLALNEWYVVGLSSITYSAYVLYVIYAFYVLNRPAKISSMNSSL